MMTQGTKVGPLTGVRVVEFEAIGPVPLAGMLLADMGADVIQIVRPQHAASPYDNVGATVLNRGRGQVKLDLKRQSAEALSLIRHADIVIEGLRPGVMERLGLGPGECHVVNPALVYGRMTGWGQEGPMSRLAGHDINYIGLTGVLGALGSPNTPPPPPLNFVGDYGGGTMFLVMGVLAGLLQARSSGQGTVVDAAIVDGVTAMSALFLALRGAGAWSDRRQGNLLDGGRPFYRCYACADGRYVAVGALEPAFYAALLDGLGFEPMSHPQNDPSAWAASEAAFAARFAERSRDEWAVTFEGRDACVTPVLDWAEAPSHPHNAARATFMDRNGWTEPAPAPRFSGVVPSLEGPRIVDLEPVLELWRRAG